MDKLLTIKDVADILNVTKRTIYNYIQDNKLKPIKVGGKLLFKENDIKELIEKSKK